MTSSNMEGGGVFLRNIIINTIILLQRQVIDIETRESLSSNAWNLDKKAKKCEILFLIHSSEDDLVCPVSADSWLLFSQMSEVERCDMMVPVITVHTLTLTVEIISQSWNSFIGQQLITLQPSVPLINL